MNDVDAEAVDRAAARAEVKEALKTFFREFGIATWALLVGAAAGVYAAWLIYQAYLAMSAGLFYLASVGVVFTLGAASTVVAWTAIKLIAFVARRNDG
jgi:hypothetical protein